MGTMKPLGQGVVVVVLLVAPLTAAAQQHITGSLAVRVTDEGGAPLAGARVTLQSDRGALAGTTNSNGRLLANLAASGGAARQVWQSSR